MLFAASPNASTDRNVLKQAFQMMGNTGITQHGIDADENKYYPSTVIDGHIS
jgi:hypothetical protein